MRNWDVRNTVTQHEDYLFIGTEAITVCVCVCALRSVHVYSEGPRPIVYALPCLDQQAS